ncbi:MAG TPA: serine/threonine-protein kinase [Gemmatimonadales bacterium]|nr:serine/threonine-protein kinase [Gemmatimonadales bacterium]
MLLVCSSCHAPLPSGSTHCPRCGPGSLALLGADGLGAPREAPPDALGRLARALGETYRVVRMIGRGGFAEVYEVIDTGLQRRLAVKVLRSDLHWSSSAVSRFTQETRAIARLNHPNTIPIHFVGEGEGLVFYAMPFLEGRTVAELLRTEGPPGVERTLGIIEPVLEALQQAHEHGLVHRDLKPENIVIEAGTGRPLLVDFGIVKNLESPADITETGYIVGTPLYMSPEQALGSHKVDSRSDLYAVGAVLFHLLTGAPPFPGEDSQEIVGRHIREPLPVGSLSRDGIPPWLARVVVRCLAKHPDDRYPSAAALLEALRAGRAAAPAGVILPSDERQPSTAEDALTEQLGSAAGPGAVPSHGRRTGRRRIAVAAALIVAAVGTTLLTARDADPAAAALVVHNRLVEPIVVTVDDSGLMVAPERDVRIPVRSGAPLEAHWAMVRPTHAGRVLGQGVEGAIVADRVEGERRERVDASSGGVLRYAPVVINRTHRRLRVTVVDDADSVDCGCFLAPGDSLRLGYYPLGGRSLVRVTDSAGRVARYPAMLGPRDSVTGAMRIPVESADLADLKAARPAPSTPAPKPPVPAPRRKAPPSEEPDPLGRILPVH